MARSYQPGAPDGSLSVRTTGEGGAVRGGAVGRFAADGPRRARGSGAGRDRGTPAGPAYASASTAVGRHTLQGR